MSDLCSYVLWCSLCEKGYSSKSKWLAHLLLKAHQTLAIKSCKKWETTDLDCCMMVFTKTGSNPALVLNYFNDLQGFRGGLVADIVWSKEQTNNVLVLRFESRLKVDGIFATLGSSQGLIDGQPFEMRRLADYMPFERQYLLPWIGRPLETKTTLLDVVSMKASASSSSSTAKSTSQLVQDFVKVLKAIEIPKHEFEQVLQLMKQLQSILETHLTGCKLFLFRHWYLRLRAVGTNELLIFVRHDKLLETKTTAEFYLEIFKNSSNCAFEKDQNPGTNAEPHGRHFVDISTGIKFTLVDFGFLYTEMQTCQLVNHLSTFDPRIKCLLAVVLYWAKNNDALLQQQLVTLKDFTSSAPVPAAWEWLVVFYLMHEKVIPNLQAVVRDGHETGDRTLHARLLDPGFDMKPDFVDNFHLKELDINEAFVWSVVELAQGFFKFYGDHIQNGIQCSGCILNLRDGSIIIANRTQNTGRCFHFKKLSECGTKLSVNEKSVLGSWPFLSKFTQAIANHAENGIKVPIYLLHPLYFRNGFVLDSTKLVDTWQEMKIAAETFETLIKNKGDFCWKQILGAEKPEYLEKRGKKRKRTMDN